MPEKIRQTISGCQHRNCMDSNTLSLRLLSGGMPDDATHLARLGFWLRIARERAGKSQSGAAQELNLSAASKSTVSDWENGVREPSLKQLRALARYYEVPLGLFIDPPTTAFEDLDRMTALATAALAAEAADWEQGSAGERDRDAGDAPGDLPGRRSA